jgi:hypothetical protein
VLTDPAVRASLIARRLERAARFNWDRTAAEMIVVYRTLAGQAS